MNEIFLNIKVISQDVNKSVKGVVKESFSKPSIFAVANRAGTGSEIHGSGRARVGVLVSDSARALQN